MTEEVLNYIIKNPFQFSGVVLSILYVILSIKQNILCWLALIAASLLNMIAYQIINLPLQAFMQLFFIITAIYGWYNWNKKKGNKKIFVKKIGLKENIFYTVLGIISTLILTIILEKFKIKSEYPFLDSLMFAFNIIPMYMTGKKIIDSWLYFICIDIISGFFYLKTGEYFFAILFFSYIIFATIGFFTWKKMLKSTK
tara:strand:- start:1962 stop:2555 length:594 start_codon:yes stop_codon:yes gene_type:complete